jgi:hypothetical protein
LEEDFDDADAQQRARLRVVDAAGQREKAFQWVGDIGFDVLRRHARVKRRYYDLRQIDGGKEVDGHACKTRGADHQQGQADHHDEVWIANGEP